MTALQVFHGHSLSLIQCLPMDDAVFITKLTSSGLLSGNLKATVQSQPTPMDKAMKFLDQAVEPFLKSNNLIPFHQLLTVMQTDDNDNIRMLATTIKSQLDSGVSLSSGTDAAMWLAGYMKGRYRNIRVRKCNEERDPWPPVPVKSYVTLALVHQKDIRTQLETVMAIHIRTKGEICAIPEKTNTKKLKDLSEIFDFVSGRKPKAVLIEGYPGIGKTTLVKEICVQWAEGKLLTSDKLVLLLLLRDPNVQRITNVQQLIEHFTQSTSKVTQLHSYLEDNHGADVTLIIDGFDELSNEQRQNSFFRELIEKHHLPEACIVVTSRPSASSCLHNIVERRIEILGFEPSSKHQYAYEALQDTPLKLEKLHKHFQQYPNIDAICYIPLILSIIVFLCMCQPEDLPPTASKMYASFILYSICHFLKRRNMLPQLVNKMEHLPQSVQQALQQLQKVAFDGLVEDKIVFTMDDLPDMCRDDPTCYGLLQSVECYSVNEVGMPTQSFNFLHLGIQEYLAAEHVASLGEEDVHSLLKETMFVFDTEYNEYGYLVYTVNKKSVRLANMWVLYCGVVWRNSHIVSRAMKNFLHTYTNNSFHEGVISRVDPQVEAVQSDLYWSIIRESSKASATDAQLTSEQSTSTLQQEHSDNYNIKISTAILSNAVNVLYLFQCFQEAHDDKMCQVLSHCFNDGIINLSDQRLLPHQVVSLGFFLLYSCREWKKLNLQGCHMGDHGLSLLHRYLCGDKGKDAKILRISVIDLEYNDLTDVSSPLIADIITHAHPSALWLGYNYCCYGHEISTAITATPTVKVIRLHYNKIRAKQIELLLSVMSSIHVLDLSSNQFCDDGAKLLSKGIENTCTLKALDLESCGIETDGLVSIARALSRNNSLQVLILNRNKLRLDAVTEMAKSIRVNSTLKELHLSYTIPLASSLEGLRIRKPKSLLCNQTIVEINLTRSPDMIQMIQLINDQRPSHNKLKVIDSTDILYDVT